MPRTPPGGLFGGTPATPTSGLFGDKPASGGLFGDKPSPGGLFGSATTPPSGLRADAPTYQVGDKVEVTDDAGQSLFDPPGPLALWQTGEVERVLETAALFGSGTNFSYIVKLSTGGIGRTWKAVRPRRAPARAETAADAEKLGIVSGPEKEDRQTLKEKVGDPGLDVPQGGPSGASGPIKPDPWGRSGQTSEDPWARLDNFGETRQRPPTHPSPAASSPLPPELGAP
jgi:hypothetical protein